MTDWTGGCLCGAIKYRATADPVRAVNCHCGMCRRFSGAAFLTHVHFPVEHFEWLGGKPTVYRSSGWGGRGFCPACGSSITMHEDVLTDRVQVTLGSLDRPDDAPPDDHVWFRDRVKWLRLDDDLTKFETSSDTVPTDAPDD